ncbi:hypothetical protein FQA39_LY15672 [Lamprigera yunnana]|nr:hypothetical protein FQA39_LY15672 [Lamprigera yunnana]
MPSGEAISGNDNIKGNTHAVPPCFTYIHQHKKTHHEEELINETGKRPNRDDNMIPRNAKSLRRTFTTTNRYDILARLEDTDSNENSTNVTEENQMEENHDDNEEEHTEHKEKTNDNKRVKTTPITIPGNTNEKMQLLTEISSTSFYGRKNRAERYVALLPPENVSDIGSSSDDEEMDLDSHLEPETLPPLQDTKPKFYSKHAQADALIKITDDIQPNMQGITIEDVKKKLNNLRFQFAHENNEDIASRKSGIGTDDINEPAIWCNFDESSQQQEAATSEIIRVTPKVTKRRKVEMEDSDPVMDEALATLHNLDKTIKNSTICASPKTDSNIFAEYMAQELQVINDLKLLIDAKHEINNVRKGKSNFDESSQQQEAATSEIIRVTPKVTKRRKVEMEDSDPVMDEALATLHNLDRTIKNSTTCASPKTDSNIFAEYMAQELQVINDLKLLIDAKHEINNVLYNYKKNI